MVSSRHHIPKLLGIRKFKKKYPRKDMKWNETAVYH